MLLSRLRPTIERFVHAWPGERQLGIYRFLPLFFGLGAALEFSMINWTVGTTNFCEYCAATCAYDECELNWFSRAQTPSTSDARPRRLSRSNCTECVPPTSFRLPSQNASRRQLGPVSALLDRSVCVDDGRFAGRALLLQAAGGSAGVRGEGADNA